MSDVFDDTLKAAADSFFALPGAEYVTYRPRTGLSHRIRAVVTRSQWQPLPGKIEGGSRPPLYVLVKNDAAAGISSEAVDTGGDELDVAPVINEPPIAMRITDIVNQDAGLMLLLAQ
jgi:hypothetical protein